MKTWAQKSLPSPGSQDLPDPGRHGGANSAARASAATASLLENGSHLPRDLRHEDKEWPARKASNNQELEQYRPSKMESHRKPGSWMKAAATNVKENAARTQTVCKGITTCAYLCNQPSIFFGCSAPLKPRTERRVGHGTRYNIINQSTRGAARLVRSFWS